MNLKNNSKGITLIALVITIIVLLILAGVSLNLVAGGDGILSKAVNAVKETNEAKIAEEIDLALAELKTTYFEERYVDRTTNKEFEAYVADKLESTEDGTKSGFATTNGTIKLNKETNKITYENDKNEVIATGTFNAETGTITEIKTPTSDSSDKTETTKYTVSYDANGGTGSVPASAEYEENATVTVDFATVPTKEGFEFLGWASTTDAGTAAYTSSGTTSFTMKTSNVTLYAVWGGTNFANLTVANYGEYVNLGTSYVKGNALQIGTAEEDWRIFHKDSNGVYLILADYLPYSYETSAVAGSSTGLGTGLLNKGSQYPYNWKSNTDRTDLITRLNDTTTWSKLLSSTYTAKGITVKGALDLQTWVKSWNKKGDTELFTEFTTDTETYNVEGWLVGNTNPPTTTRYDLSSDTGYGNTLYFPHQEDVSHNWGYWLASPSAFNTNCVMNVPYFGYVYDYGSCGDTTVGVRPAVFVPSDIQAEKVDGVWELDI